MTQKNFIGARIRVAVSDPWDLGTANPGYLFGEIVDVRTEPGSERVVLDIAMDRPVQFPDGPISRLSA